MTSCRSEGRGRCARFPPVGDRGGNARRRREEYVGPWFPEPLLTDPYEDPERSAELADSLSMAALLLLERLSPLEPRPGSPVRRDPLVRKKNAILTDRVPARPPHPRKELIHRLLTRRCELCSDPGKVVIHQVRKLTSLGQPGPDQPVWAAKMAQMRRKTLVVCGPCHDTIHATPVTNAA
jgi:hypothetical protein